LKRKIVKCPYCGAYAALRPATVVHGKRAQAGEKLWICSRYPACDSYVGVHKNNNEPLGTLANKALRRKRIDAHRVFNQLSDSGMMNRGQSYKWLQAKFALSNRQAHIGKLSEYMCDEVIAACSEVLRNNRLMLASRSEFRARNSNLRHDTSGVCKDKEPPMPIASRLELCAAKLCGRHHASDVCSDNEPPAAA